MQLFRSITERDFRLLLIEWLEINRGGAKMRRKDLKDRSNTKCQHVFEASLQPAKLMQVVNPDPWSW